MKYAPFIDLVILLLNIYFAIVNRGTILGWLSVAIVLFYVWLIVKTIREA